MDHSGGARTRQQRRRDARAPRAFPLQLLVQTGEEQAAPARVSMSQAPPAAAAGVGVRGWLSSLLTRGVTVADCSLLPLPPTAQARAQPATSRASHSYPTAAGNERPMTEEDSRSSHPHHAPPPCRHDRGQHRPAGRQQGGGRGARRGRGSGGGNNTHRAPPLTVNKLKQQGSGGLKKTCFLVYFSEKKPAVFVLFSMLS